MCFKTKCKRKQKKLHLTNHTPMIAARFSACNPFAKVLLVRFYREFAGKMGSKGFLGNIPQGIADMILNYQWVEDLFAMMEQGFANDCLAFILSPIGDHARSSDAQGGVEYSNVLDVRRPRPPRRQSGRGPSRWSPVFGRQFRRCLSVDAHAPVDTEATVASEDTRRLFYQTIARHQGRLSSLNLALANQHHEQEFLEGQVHNLQHQLAEVGHQIEEGQRPLNCAEEGIATLSRYPLLRAWNALRASSLARSLVLGRPIRATIAATLAVLAAAIHCE